VRKTLAAAALAAGVAATLAPAPATAYCDTLTYALTGMCGNPCTVTATAYDTARNVSRGTLPPVQFVCFA
jgi:hypothetical protein